MTEPIFTTAGTLSGTLHSTTIPTKAVLRGDPRDLPVVITPKVRAQYDASIGQHVEVLGTLVYLCGTLDSVIAHQIHAVDVGRQLSIGEDASDA